MKKSLLISAAVIAVIALSNLRASAQTTTTTEPVLVNINLSDVCSIILGEAVQTVNFNYNTAAKYGVRQDVSMADHFTVISNKAYTVKVAGDGPFKGPGTPASDIALNTVSVNVTSATPSTGVSELPIVPLSTTATTIITGAAPTNTTKYTINYAIPMTTVGNLLDKAIGTYKANIVYSITQP